MSANQNGKGQNQNNGGNVQMSTQNQQSVTINVNPFVGRLFNAGLVLGSALLHVTKEVGKVAIDAGKEVIVNIPTYVEKAQDTAAEMREGFEDMSINLKQNALTRAIASGDLDKIATANTKLELAQMSKVMKTETQKAVMERMKKLYGSSEEEQK
jgi:hypothetical protein